MHLLEIAARWAWETSLAASVLIAVSLMAALALRKPVFTPIRNILGLLVIVRLLLPFAIPSPLSIFNFLAATQNGLSLPVAITQPLADPVSISTHAVKSVGGSRRKTIPLLPVVWILGVATISARVIRQHLKVRKW